MQSLVQRSNEPSVDFDSDSFCEPLTDECEIFYISRSQFLSNFDVPRLVLFRKTFSTNSQRELFLRLFNIWTTALAHEIFLKIQQSATLQGWSSNKHRCSEHLLRIYSETKSAAVQHSCLKVTDWTCKNVGQSMTWNFLFISWRFCENSPIIWPAWSGFCILTFLTEIRLFIWKIWYFQRSWPDPSKANTKPGQSFQSSSGSAAGHPEEDREDIETEEQIENDDPEYLARKRAMDEYKDSHRRGWGNRANRSWIYHHLCTTLKHHIWGPTKNNSSVSNILASREFRSHQIF